MDLRQGPLRLLHLGTGSLLFQVQGPVRPLLHPRHGGRYLLLDELDLLLPPPALLCRLAALAGQLPQLLLEKLNLQVAVSMRL